MRNDNELHALEINCFGYLAPRWLLQLSLSWFYFLLGLIYATWISRIPDTKAALNLSNGELGLVLVCAIFGGMMGLPLVTWLINTIGSGKAVLIGGLASSFLCPMAGATFLGIWTLCFGVAGIGFGMAVLDVSSNAHAVCIEKLMKINFLGFLQAVNALGSLTGVLFGGTLASYNISPFHNFLIVAFFGCIISIIFSQFLVSYEYEKYLENTSKVDKTENVKIIENYSSIDSNSAQVGEIQEETCYGFNKVLIILCFLGFINLMGVGSVNDWSTVYFQTILNTTPFFTSMGYAFFITFQMFGQICSDWLVVSLGPKNMLVIAGILTFIGLSCVVFAPALNFTLSFWAYGPYLLGLFGFSLAGIGLSFVGPILVSQTGKLPVKNMTSAGKIGVLTACSYLGLLIGPPIFGGLSMLLSSLRWALLVDAFLMFLFTPFAGLAFKDTAFLPIVELSYLKRDDKINQHEREELI